MDDRAKRFYGIEPPPLPTHKTDYLIGGFRRDFIQVQQQKICFKNNGHRHVSIISFFILFKSSLVFVY